MNIKSNRITFRAIELDDLAILQNWANDAEIQYMLGGWHFPTNMNDQKKWFELLSCNSLNQRFIIVDNQNQIPIGMVNLININFKDGNAEHGLLIDKKFQGKGFGFEAVNLIMTYAFNELRLNRLETTIISINEPSLKLFAKCGWKREGILRDWYFRKGEYIDKILLGILKKDFLE